MRADRPWILSVAAAVALLVFRFLWTLGLAYGFLAWNLFLACLPLLFAWLASIQRERALAALAWGAMWLLFFPNAPYLLTDVIHLRPRPPIPVWYDALLLLTFAWVGLSLGWRSLELMAQVVTDRFGPDVAGYFRLASVLLASFGVYAGRVLRWNSWDAFLRPGELIQELWAHSREPHLLWRMVVTTGLLAAILSAARAAWQLAHRPYSLRGVD